MQQTHWHVQQISVCIPSRYQRLPYAKRKVQFLCIQINCIVSWTKNCHILDTPTASTNKKRYFLSETLYITVSNKQLIALGISKQVVFITSNKYNNSYLHLILKSVEEKSNILTTYGEEANSDKSNANKAPTSCLINVWAQQCAMGARRFQPHIFKRRYASWVQYWTCFLCGIQLSVFNVCPYHSKIWTGSRRQCPKIPTFVNWPYQRENNNRAIQITLTRDKLNGRNVTDCARCFGAN